MTLPFRLLASKNAISKNYFSVVRTFDGRWEEEGVSAMTDVRCAPVICKQGDLLSICYGAEIENAFSLYSLVLPQCVSAFTFASS